MVAGDWGNVFGKLTLSMEYNVIVLWCITLIISIIIFHESGVPIYVWPEEQKDTSILTSFFSAIQQFAQVHFSQNVSLIGMERENILFLRHREYILSIVFSDMNEVLLVDRISRRILRGMQDILEREFDELQFNIEQVASQLRMALDRSGFFWLYEIASSVIRHENIMGISILEIDNSGRIRPLYHPLEPYLGFEKIMACSALCLKVLWILRQKGIEPLKLTFMANNGNAIQAWFFNNMIAILEYHFESDKLKNALDILGEGKAIDLALVRDDPFLEIVFSLNIDILGDIPYLCQLRSLERNIVLDFTKPEIQAYEIELEKEITSL